MQGYAIVVVGASAGGVPALIELVKRLPADLPAAVFVVLHVAQNTPSLLAGILSRHTSLAVEEARDGEPIRTGHIYVARPDYHLLIEEGRVRLGHGPKEHYTRPAVDPLFRTAAETYGPRVIGIVLTGGRANGTRGMLAIKHHGGIAMVQDPVEALFPSMPASVMQAVEVDYVLRISELARVLVDLTQKPLDAHVTELTPSPPLGAASCSTGHLPTSTAKPDGPSLTCPQCGGALNLLTPEALAVFGCAIGHAFSGEELLEAQSDELESALWSAFRIADQQAHLAAWFVRRSPPADDPSALPLHRARIASVRHTASVLRQLLEAREPTVEEGGVRED